ncbi:MAG: carboxypeptidase regulatory-like domain-containing protein, partial [Flavobacteriaceae bacterium]
MDRKFFFLGVALCVLQSVGAQKVTIEGRVTDTLQNPLELANVIAIGKSTQAVASYGITDAEGRYRLPNLIKDSIYTIRASYLGYGTWEANFTATANRVWDIQLEPAPNQLEGVELVEELPVTVNGDTITYKADAFTTGHEKKLENILEQLPGFEVDDEGKIKVQGKEVSKVLVEGKEFFDGDTKMATKNIPANAVDKVQVLRNFNEITPMRGVTDSDALALNVKLKDGKKNLWFGDVSMGAGPKDRQLAHSNLFYYSPKNSINFIGDINNIGEQAFTLQDYFRFNGGLASLARKSGSSVALSSDEIGLSLLQNNQARSINTKLAALNTSYRPNKKIDITAFGIFSATDTHLESRSQRTYIGNTAGSDEVLLSDTEQGNRAGLCKLSGTYTPNAQWYLNYDGFLKTSTIEDDNQRFSDFGSFTNTIESINKRRPLSVEQTFGAYYAKDNNNLFSLESDYLYKRLRPQYTLSTTQQPFMDVLPLEGDDSFRIFQDKEVITRKIGVEFNYYRVLDKTNHMNMTMGVNHTGQELASTIRERFGDGSESILNDMFVNDVRLRYLDIYVGLGYRVKWGKLTLSPSVALHRYNTENTQFNTTFELDKTMLLPKVGAKYDFNNTRTLRFDYRISTEFANVGNVAEAIQITGYNSLFSGNRTLRNSWYHDFSLNYFNFSTFNFTNINGGISYQKRYHTIGTALDFNGFDQRTVSLNIDRPDEIFSARGNYERRFSYWKGQFDATLSYGKYHNQIEASPNFNRSFSQQYKLSLETRFREAPNVEVGFEKIWNDYASTTVKNRYVTNRPF